jgi:BCD family chlorophyll transporter-like MFS transporter
VLTLLFNLAASWKQEAAPCRRARGATPGRPSFSTTWARFAHGPHAALHGGGGLGTAAFNMQDIILEPYGGEVLQVVGGRHHACSRR